MLAVRAGSTTRGLEWPLKFDVNGLVLSARGNLRLIKAQLIRHMRRHVDSQLYDESGISSRNSQSILSRTPVTSGKSVTWVRPETRGVGSCSTSVPPDYGYRAIGRGGFKPRNSGPFTTGFGSSIRTKAACRPWSYRPGQVPSQKQGSPSARGYSAVCRAACLCSTLKRRY